MAEILYQAAALIALAGMLLTLWRLMRGPTAADRVVALDSMTIISISLIAAIASLTQRIIYMDVALIYALISFIGVVAVARYLERGI